MKYTEGILSIINKLEINDTGADYSQVFMILLQN